MKVKSFGIYILKDEFLDNTYPDFYPGKGKRPFVLLYQDINSPKVLWALPFSKAEKYEKIKEKYPTNIVDYQMPNYKSFILVQNIFPLTRDDVESEYIYRNIHVCIKNKSKQKEILKKSDKMLSLIKYNKVPQHQLIQDMYEKITDDPLLSEAHELIDEKDVEVLLKL